MRAFFHCVLFFGFINVALGDSGDDTLRYYLTKSDFVVMGEIVSEPFGISTELGVIHYSCDFKVSQVARGLNRGDKADEIKSDTQIKVNIIRFEKDEADKCPEIKKGGKCILFLKKADQGNFPTWQTADFWFGVQRASPWMMRSLVRLAGENQGKVKENVPDTFPLATVASGKPNKPCDESVERLGGKTGCYVKVERVRDFNDLVVLFGDEEIAVQLANVTPLSSWPEPGDDQVKKVREQALQFIQQQLTGEEVFLKMAGGDLKHERPTVYLSWTAKHRTRKPWHGKLPSEKIGWGMTSINLFLVENGYALYTSEIAGAPPKPLAVLFEDAELLAQKATVGIWSVAELAHQIRSTEASE
jgi:endonuclease YncB( thermonuclease family)